MKGKDLRCSLAAALFATWLFAAPAAAQPTQADPAAPPTQAQPAQSEQPPHPAQTTPAQSQQPPHSAQTVPAQPERTPHPEQTIPTPSEQPPHPAQAAPALSQQPARPVQAVPPASAAEKASRRARRAESRKTRVAAHKPAPLVDPACLGDFKRLCKGLPLTKSEVSRCLQVRAAELSNPCRATMPASRTAAPK
jgi:hypothetical protein